jgi:hypothetical protein
VKQVAGGHDTSLQVAGRQVGRLQVGVDFIAMLSIAYAILRIRVWILGSGQAISLSPHFGHHIENRFHYLRAKNNPVRNPLTIVALFLLAQLLLYFVSIKENIMSGGEAIFFTLVLGFFIGLFLIGFRWARWIAIILLALVMLISGTLTFQGFGAGFILIAFLYAGVIALLFNYRLPVMQRDIPADAPIAESLDAPSSLPPADNGFYFGDKLYQYPLLVKRYQSVAIDAMLWLVLMVVAMVLLGNSEGRSPVMLSLMFIALFIYEPLLTTYSVTIGQRAMGIRVRKMDNPEERIGLIDAYARVIVKWLLGWMSFITINFNHHHRAIHDFAGSSVVVQGK